MLSVSRRLQTLEVQAEARIADKITHEVQRLWLKNRGEEIPAEHVHEIREDVLDALRGGARARRWRSICDQPTPELRAEAYMQEFPDAGVSFAVLVELFARDDIDNERYAEALFAPSKEVVSRSCST